MRISLILASIIFLIAGCISNRSTQKEEDHLLLISGRDLTEFRNWYIYPRNDNNFYVLDYILKDTIIVRYTFVMRDSLYEKREWSLRDSTTISPLILKGLEEVSQIDLLCLFANFKSLNVDALYSIPDDSLFIIKKDGVTIRYNPEKGRLMNRVYTEDK